MVWAGVSKGHCSTAIQTTLAPTTTKKESTLPCAKEKTWMKQVEDSLKNRHLTLVDAKTLSTDQLAWGQLVEVAGRLSAPTAAYELRSCIRNSAS